MTHTTLYLCLLLLFSYNSLFAQDNSIHHAFHFETAKSTITTADQDLLQKIATTAKNWTNHDITINGHTDNIGSDQYNIDLSKDRANDVKNWFIQAGIPSERIIVKAFGESQPIESNLFENGRHENRRVEISLSNLKEEDYLVQTAKRQAVIEQLLPPTPTIVLENAQAAQYIEAPQGTKVYIPANAFDVAEGTQVEIKITEAYKKSDMILHQLSTMSNGRRLVSGGMIKVEALANGQPVQLKPGKKLDINVPADNPDPRMEIFYSDASGQNINWIKPRPLAINTGNVQEAAPVDIFNENNWRDMYDGRHYYNANNSPIGKKAYLNRLPFKPRDKSLSLPYIFPPFVDSSKLVFWKKMKVKIAAEIENPCQDDDDCRRKYARMNKKRKKALTEKNTQRLNNATHQIEKQGLAIEKMIVDYKDYEIKLEKREQEKIKLHEDYLQKMVEWKVALDSVDNANFEIACENKDLRYLEQSFSKREKEACQKAFEVNTFKEVHTIINDNAIRKYVRYSSPRRCKFDSAQVEQFLVDFPSKKEIDQEFMYLACLQIDSNYVKWKKGEKGKNAMLLKMYGAETLAEVRQYQKEERLAAKLAFYEQKMEELGVDSPEEAIRVMQELTIKKRDWDKQMGYVFETANLGNWINCDYFPGKTDELLVNQNFELPVSPKRTTTYLIFKDIASVMSGSPVYSNLQNFYKFSNIPENKAVEVLSFFIDTEGNTQVAFMPMNVHGKFAEKLDYKTMSIEEFKAVLTRMDV